MAPPARSGVYSLSDQYYSGAYSGQNLAGSSPTAQPKKHSPARPYAPPLCLYPGPCFEVQSQSPRSLNRDFAAARAVVIPGDVGLR